MTSVKQSLFGATHPGCFSLGRVITDKLLLFLLLVLATSCPLYEMTCKALCPESNLSLLEQSVPNYSDPSVIIMIILIVLYVCVILINVKKMAHWHNGVLLQ